MLSNTKPQLHVSMLDTLSRCGEQFRRRYGSLFGWNDKPEIIPPGSALITGIATHKAIEKNLLNKIQSGELLPVEAVKEAARDEVNGLWSQEVRLSPEESGISGKVHGDVIDMAVALSSLHAEELAPGILPKAVERKWVINLSGYPFDLAGTMDIEETTGAIRDTKTAGKTPNQSAADNSNQLTMYALAKKVCDNEVPTALYMDNLIKLKKPKVVTLETSRDESDYEMLLRRIERAMEIIEKGAFQPANPTDWACSQSWCGYWDSCPFANRRKTFAITNGE